jgi:succinate dehydrogenase / fumarate reductase iron-sulfur subunit
MDDLNRREQLRREAGVGMCNITKCCTEVCPEHIRITDNAIIPLKERVADDYFDPIAGLLRKIGVIKRVDKRPMASIKNNQTKIMTPEQKAVK